MLQGPTGAVYPTRLDALRAMEQWGAGQTEVERMRESFALDGFEAVDGLPEGWMVNKGQTFLTSSLELIEGTERALVFMKEHTYPEEEIKCFKDKWGGVDEGWVEEDTLPKGWTMRRAEAGTEIRDVNRQVLGSRAQAIKYLSTREQVDQEEVAKMRLGLGRDGWMSAENLPSNWLTKKREDESKVYLTEKYEVIKSVKNALSYMKMKNYSQEIINRFISESPNKRKVESEEEVQTKRVKENTISGSVVKVEP